MPSVNQAAAALRALVVSLVGGVSDEEFDRRLEGIDSAIADVRCEMEDVRAQVDEHCIGGRRVVELDVDLGVRKWEGSA